MRLTANEVSFRVVATSSRGKNALGGEKLASEELYQEENTSWKECQCKGALVRKRGSEIAVVRLSSSETEVVR